VLHVPVERGRHAYESHGFSGGRAIQHNDVVTLLAPKLVDVHHRAELFHTRQNGQFLGFHIADPRGAQHGNHVRGDLAPVPLNLSLDVHFMDRQLFIDLIRIPGLVVEETGLEIERIRQAVGRVHAHHQRAMAQLGQLQPGCGGQTGLAHPTLS
jgi:hypothetical protein